MSINYRSFPGLMKAKPIPYVPQGLQQKLGVGLMLPLQCDNNIWETLSGLQKIEQNMALTIMTPVGRSLGQPDFGTIVPYCLFENYDELLQQQMIVSIQSALATWVPQISVSSVTFDASLVSENVVLINVTYQLKETAAQSSLLIGYVTPDSVQYPPGFFMVNNNPVVNP